MWGTLTDGTPVVVTSHIRLDGDGIGAALALWHSLKGRGLECAVFFEPPVPAVFGFLPGADQRVSSLDELPERFHLAVLDCGSLDRIGSLARLADRAVRIVNIDHHVTNDAFGHINYVDRSAGSCGELVYRMITAGGSPITKEIADCLFTAIVTDTGRFCYANTTGESFEICARLVSAGCRPHELVDRICCSPSPDLVRLQGLAIGTLRFEEKGRIATMEITSEMFERTGIRPVDTQGFADIPVFVQGVMASALLKETPPESGCPGVKVSLRSRPGDGAVDVCAVAESFGGGGHRHAAGFEMEGSLADARRAVVGRLRRELRS